MDRGESQRLNEIATHWTQVQLALHGKGPAAADAQGELFKRYRGAMHRYLLVALRDAAAVDDVMQEVALAAVRQQSPLLDPTKLAPWLYRLALNHCLDYVRSRQAKMNKLTETLDAELSFEPAARREKDSFPNGFPVEPAAPSGDSGSGAGLVEHLVV